MSDANQGELRPITAEELPDTLSYLAAAPLRNLILIGFLKSGVASEGNTLFGFWKDGVHKGVGLLGSVAAWSGGPEVARALGERALASGTSQLNMVVGLTDEVQVFLEASQDSRRGEMETHVLYVLRRGDLQPASHGSVSVRPARREEFEQLFRIHTDLFFELIGRPLSEPEVSKQRLLRRIVEGRVWIASEGDEIVFKADAASETHEVVLIEAVWTTPALRGQGIGVKALSALCEHLLENYPMLCLSLGRDRADLQRFYERIGFKYYGDDGDYTVVRY